MTTKKKATIQDVSEHSGLSTATVSRVINGKDKVSENTKKRVMESIEELGFEARRSDQLSDNESKTILVCATELKNPFNVPVIDGIQNSAYKHGYDILLLQTKNLYTEFSDYESVLKSQRFAGLVFLSSVTSAQLQTITEKLNYRLPIVFCSEYIEDIDIPYVCINDIEAMYKSTSYALSVGCRNIAYLNSSLKHNYAKKREIGFRKAMAENNVPVNEEMIVHLSSVNYSLAYSNTLHLLSQEVIPDAIVCSADTFAIGAINACRKMGVRVPEDCAVIGFDNIELAIMAHPPITTIEQPSYQLGYQACELLIERIFNPEVATKRIVLETELIVRESTPININRGGIQ